MRFSDARENHCPICDASGVLLYGGMRDRWQGVQGEWSLQSCPACGLVWLHPRPTADPGALNAEAYYTHESAPLPAPHASLAKRALLAAVSALPIARELLAARTMFLPAHPQGSLLDVGCGNGAFLALMQQRGWGVNGVEPDAAAARVASEAIGREVFAGPLEQAGFAENQFAAITMSHVIEHVPEPVETLQTCLRLLQPGGTLYLTTPNTRSLGRRTFDRAWLHWDPPRHLFLFNPDNMRTVIRAAGFPSAKITTISRAARWSWRASNTIHQHGSLIENGGAGAADKLRAAAFHLREHFLAGPDGGEEVLVMATKATIGMHS
jgi:SAM-dependent methyltransferase